MSSAKTRFVVVCWLGQRTFSDIGRVVSWFASEYPYISLAQRQSFRCFCGTADFTNIAVKLTEQEVERNGWVLISRLAKE